MFRSGVPTLWTARTDMSFVWEPRIATSHERNPKCGYFMPGYFRTVSNIGKSQFWGWRLWLWNGHSHEAEVFYLELVMRHIRYNQNFESKSYSIMIYWSLTSYPGNRWKASSSAHYSPIFSKPEANRRGIVAKPQTPMNPCNTAHANIALLFEAQRERKRVV